MSHMLVLGVCFVPRRRGYDPLLMDNAAPRALIVRKLKGLESIISVTSVHYEMSLTDSWRFCTADDNLPMEDCTPDPLHPDFKRLKQLYLHANPNYQGRFSVPVLWDKQLETIVSNESSEIIRMLYTDFDEFLPEDKRAIDLYPAHLRKQIDEVNEWTHIEAHLESQGGPYYFGSTITEADIRLYVTIVRFDPVYDRFDYPNIHGWLLNLYWNVKAFRDTTSFEHIKNHYFMSLTMLNPNGIVPEGPVPDILPWEEL
ncbi:E1 ubiquitin-activating protein [Elasticomyces elasticus]|uniref:S-glutathionyl-(Chloro)hydroquinone reductase n=1 Tax=Exophiala sideris TaxID=1016849 RepID=A0ABR0IUX4_9EURO|nr:E1 ubiquitin-activating protein [Elasticomyces elasticus]KAK5023788.1 E1 ubiquitin-activating protein [Exophiala sideris]KAK5048867.1 S-glutathionyl-(chloro)hydroquinone reductase [Exophiala sideris]